MFKRKIVLKSADGPSDDQMYSRLVYLQAVDEVVIGSIPIDTEDDAANLAAMAMAVDLNDAMPDNEDDLVASDLIEYLPKPWRDNLPPAEWATKVLAHRDSLLEMEPEAVQAKYVELVLDHPLYGTCLFHVRRLRFPPHMESYPEHVIIALNSEGLHFLNEERETLYSFGYADIYRWSGTSTVFKIVVWNAETQDTDEVLMYTSQAVRWGGGGAGWV